MQTSRIESNSAVALTLSVFIALVLSMISVTDALYYFWPDWVVLVVIFWCMVEPERYGPLLAVFVGLILDVLTVNTFGVASLGLAFVAFFVNKSSYQLKVMTTWQQTMLIGFMLGILKLLTGWVYGMVEDFGFTWSFWYSILGSMMAWPFVFIALSELRRFARLR